MRLLLVGNYGVGNAGDEVLREYFLKRFPEVEWHVCSAKPHDEELPRFPAGFRSFFTFRWMQTYQALRTSDGLVFGGGSLFTDTESVHACLIWLIHAWFARLLRKPYYLTFQGIGPFKTSMGEWCARNVARHAAFISVRDVSSADRVRMWKTSTNIVQTFDPSICLLESEKQDIRTNNLFIVIPRFSPGNTSEYWEEIGDFLRGGNVRILSLQPGDTREQKLCRELTVSLGTVVVAIASLQEAVSALRGATGVVTQRYHGALAALAAGVPFVALPQRDGDKLDTLAKDGDCPTELAGEMDWETLRVGIAEKRKSFAASSMRGEVALKKALGVYR
jgi:polysaccharide pyruvyl transferase WcaK-like protein